MQVGPVLIVDDAQAKPTDSGGQLFRADRGSRKGDAVNVLALERPPATQVPLSGRGSEYHLLGPRTAGALPAVDVLGIHYAKVKPERREEFERFVAERIHPAVANLRPDLRILYYKATRGPDAGNYIALFALTKASRDKYWPKGADSDELRAAFSPPVRALTKELSTYLVEGSYAADPKLAAAVYESREWTDFVLISPRTVPTK